MLEPYKSRPLAPEVVARVVSDALDYALSMEFAPVDVAGVQAYLEEVTERVDVILAPYRDHGDVIATSGAIKRGLRVYAFEEVGRLFRKIALAFHQLYTIMSFIVSWNSYGTPPC